MLTKSLYIVATLAGTLVWSAAAQAAPGETTGTVNLRAGPGTAFAVIGKIPAGAPVTIVKCRRWCELAYGGREGYVSPNAVVAEYAPAPYVTDRYPIIDDFYDQNEPDLSASFFGAHNHFGDGGFGGGHHHHEGVGVSGGMGGGHDRGGHRH